MRLEPIYSVGEQDGNLLSLPAPVDIEALLPGDGPWEVEIGYGKGKYLLEQARQHPERRYLGVEVVSKYYKMLTRRTRYWQATNLLNIRGEALYLLTSILPRGFAERLHIYFPDPWPKAKHHRRRLLDPETLDLVLGVLAPGAELCFATDFLDYGERVMEILQGYPGLELEPVLDPWPDGARTNYEAKYMEEGRPIIRCRARIAEPTRLHPRGEAGITAAWARRDEE